MLGAGDVFIGVNALDYSGCTDFRPAYIEALEHMANLATKAPIVRRRIVLCVDFELTFSCYDPTPAGAP